MWMYFVKTIFIYIYILCKYLYMMSKFYWLYNISSDPILYLHIFFKFIINQFFVYSSWSKFCYFVISSSL